MAATIIGLNHPLTVKRWSATLFTDTVRNSYWGMRFMGKGKDAPTPVQVLTDLERENGDTIKFDLFAQLKQKPTYGDQVLDGKEENLRNYQDQVSIEQVRCGVNGGGRMSRKRTLHDLRKVSLRLMRDWWSRWQDETLFMYLAGSRGVNDDFIEDIGFSGFGGNDIEAPDSDHLLLGGDAASEATLASDDKMDLRLIDKAVVKARTYGGGTKGGSRVVPMRINGEDKYVLLMHEFQAYDLRANSSSTQWMDIQKAAAASNGNRNPIFTGTLGEYNGVILHSHNAVVRIMAGTGNTQPCARASLMGRQALVMAYGSPGSNLRFDWHEEQRDNGNQVVIASSCIAGVKKTRFNNKDFGAFTLSTYAADPNA